MKCPKCDGELREQVLLKGWTRFTRKKIITFFCLLCDFSKEKEFSISDEDYKAEIRAKGSRKSKYK